MPAQLNTDQWLQAVLRGEQDDCSELVKPEWSLIWQEAGENGVIPLLQHCLSESGKWDSCPPFIQEQLAKYTYQAVATELARQHDLKNTLELFTQAGIQFLLMKGTPLAYSLYPEPYLRERCDTDILFSGKDEAESAWEILEKLGYERRNTTSGEFVGYQFSCSRQISHGFYQALDIHNKLNDYQFFADTFSFEELYSKSVAVPEVSESSRAFHRVHALLHACMHRVAHIPYGEGNRLIWLYDIHLLSASFSKEDWDEFCELAKEKAIAGVCLDSLQTTQKCFHTAIDPVYLIDLQTSSKDEKISPHEKGKRWEFYYLAFKSTPGVANKLKQLRGHLLPPTDYMIKKYQPRYRIQLPYLYIYRVIKGMKRYL
ncbi:MAG: nucleotidyltransferase family protein [Arenicellales bacterium]